MRLTKSLPRHNLLREMERSRPQPRHSPGDYPEPRNRQPFHRAHASMGAAHWIRTAGILAPLVIGEFVKDLDKRWRWIRIASVATALVSEGMYTHRIQKERERCEQEFER